MCKVELATHKQIFSVSLLSTNIFFLICVYLHNIFHVTIFISYIFVIPYLVSLISCHISVSLLSHKTPTLFCHNFNNCIIYQLVIFLQNYFSIWKFKIQTSFFPLLHCFDQLSCNTIYIPFIVLSLIHSSNHHGTNQQQ